MDNEQAVHTDDRKLLGNHNGLPVPGGEAGETRDSAGDHGKSTDEDVLLIIPTRNVVVFPGMVLPLAVGRERSIAAAQEAVKSERPVGLVLQKDRDVDNPGPDDLYRVGTVASVLRFVTAADGGHHLICQGEERFRILDFMDGHPYLLARVERLAVQHSGGAETEAHLHHLRQQALEALNLLPQTPQELLGAVQSTDSPAMLTDLVAAYMDLKPEEKQQILELSDVRARMERLGEWLGHRIEVLKLSQRISEQTRQSMDERQREYMLREQLRTIQKELGEGDEKSAEIEALSRAIDEAGMPEAAEQQARKELKRLERMPEGAGEYSVVRTYLDWLTELPWQPPQARDIDIQQARRILDQDHYGLEKVKRRILEYLAVRKLNPQGHSPILCFVGPPGVGKTSLGRSIARAMGREFVRVSLGGVHDEAEIRGHRRTYVGALPGNIIQNLHKAGTRNPVFMLDEMDKLGAGFHGDPSSALLEVLDPAQNDTFRDNYLAVDFDLSQVLFIGTANVLDEIPGPLRDRMEVIELAGYTEDEKVQIARRYLVGRQLAASGLREEQCLLPDETLHALVRSYTREAGCRNLEREIGAVCRYVAVRVAEGSESGRTVMPADLPAILGPERFQNEVKQRTSVPGVATGLAWTPTGGDILFIEASQAPGSGRLILTGQLGDVMKESAQAALTLIKSRAAEFGVAAEGFDKQDIHVHVPAGAIPKDGPSAGVAMFTALASLLSGRTVRADTAMTGEITLRGLVLPVGGIKEKVLAAQRAGISRVLLPARNRGQFEEIPEHVRAALEFHWIERVDQALDAALQPLPAPAASPASA